MENNMCKNHNMAGVALSVIAVLFVAGCSRQSTPIEDGQVVTNDQPAAQANVATSWPKNSWPRWRGPNMNGVLEFDQETPQKMSLGEIRWRTNVGLGYSSFAVIPHGAYTLGHTAGKETIYCLDVRTGKPKWQFSYSCQLVDELHVGGPAATPTIEDDRLYSVSKEGHFYCVDAITGEQLWKVDLQEQLGVPLPKWGFACSPLVWKDTVIVESGRTAAFDKTDGSLRWKTEQFNQGYGSVVSFQNEGRDLLALLNNDCLLVLKAASGEEIARREWRTSYETSAATPEVIGDTIFISTGYKRGCMLVRLVKDKLELVYENKNMANHMNNSVFHEGYLYGFDGNSHSSRTVTFNCIEKETGKLMWEQRKLGCGSVMLAADRLVILSEYGELLLAAPSPDGFEELDRKKVLEGKCWTVPVVAAGCIFARNDHGETVCVELAD